MVGIQPSDIICMKISTLILLIGVYTQNSIYLTYAYMYLYININVASTLKKPIPSLYLLNIMLYLGMLGI